MFPNRDLPIRYQIGLSYWHENGRFKKNTTYCNNRLALLLGYEEQTSDGGKE